MAINRKPENDCEILDSLLWGKWDYDEIVKEETVYSSTDTDKESAIMLHGVKLLIELISPWSGSRRLVCVDSYIASGQAAEVMAQSRLQHEFSQ